MDWDMYRNFLLASIEGARPASGGRVVNCRCRECPDSEDQRSAHFYISIPYDNEEPSMYYCHKCNCRGLVDTKTLLSWGIYDKDIAIELKKYNDGLKLNPRTSKFFTGYNYLLCNIRVSNNDTSERKRRYICDRLGLDLSYKDLQDLKISINLYDLLNQNHVSKLTRDQTITNDLNREFIGFISLDNAFLNMRRTCEPGKVMKEVDKRYVNYRIFNKYDTSKRFYTVPTVVDLASTQRTKLHIAEGPFDILSIYLNVREREPGIYTSIAGNNYLSTIMYFLIDMRLPYTELHFYPDRDKYGTLERMKKIRRGIPDPTIPTYVHYNLLGKDFGVPKDQINEEVHKIW